MRKRDCSIHTHRPRRLSGLLLAAAGAGLANLLPAAAFGQLNFITQWGSQGTGIGQFEYPQGVAVGPTGTVYVADYENDRVEIFSSNGTFESTFGSSGSGNGNFEFATGVAVGPTGTVYVADYYNNRVETFGPSGTFQSTFGSEGTGNGQFDGPDGLAIGPTGTVYVADTNNNRVEAVYSNGTYDSTIGSAGTANGDFEGPYSVAVGPTGTVYVADTNNNRVETFYSNGTYDSTLGSAGVANGDFEHPSGVAVGPTGTVYVADESNERIETFSSSGTFLSAFGSQGTGNGQFYGPTGVAVDPSGSGLLYVADTSNNRIQQFFDPYSWDTGTASFTNSFTGATSITIGLSTAGTVDINPGMALNVGNTTTVNPNCTVELNGGSITTSSLALNGTLNYQTGTHSLGTISINSGGGITGNPVVLNSGETLNISTGGTVSTAALTVASGASMYQGGGTISSPGVTIAGQFNYQSGTISSSSVNVASGGVMTQTGASSNLAVPVLNIGGTYQYVQGTFAPGSVAIQAGGQLEDSSAGLSIAEVIQMLPGSLITAGSGQTFTNSPSGQITGAGTITATLTNTGVIEPSGGVMTFTNSLTNNSGANLGAILIPTGGEGLFENFPQNTGTITLSGGTLNTNGAALTNYGQFAGFGIVQTGGLTNSGTISLSGQTSVYGSVTNSSGKTLQISGNSANNLFGAVTNNGTLVINAAATANLYAGYSGGSGSALIDNGSLYLYSLSTSGTISGTGILTIGSASGPANVQLSVNSGQSTQSSLVIPAGSTLDITNNSFLVKYGSSADPKATILGYLASGASGGAWNGTGIISSTAASNSQYGVGYADSADGIDTSLSSGQLEIAYVQYGDITLQGLVNAQDFSILSSNFGKIVTGGWEDGDFLYQGVVNAEDFHLLSENFGKTETGEDIATPGDWAAIDAFAAANGLSVSNVPEPAGLLALPALGLLARRRRELVKS